MSETWNAMVRRLRQERGLSQRQLAEEAGIHHTLVSKIERGRADVSRKVVRALASALDADPVECELAAGHIPRDFAQVIRDRDSLRKLLALAAAGDLSEEAYRRLEELAEEQEEVRATVVPVWPEEEDSGAGDE